MIQGERGVLIAKFKAQVIELSQGLTEAEFLFALSEIVTSSLEVSAKDNRTRLQRIRDDLPSSVLEKQSTLAWSDCPLTVAEVLDDLADDIQSA